MQKIEKFEFTPELFKKIIFAFTSDPDYEMSRVLVVEDAMKYSNYVVITGGHCSCYGFDEVEWEAIEYTEEELKKLAATWKDNSWDSPEKELGIFLNHYLN